MQHRAPTVKSNGLEKDTKELLLPRKEHRPNPNLDHLDRVLYKAVKADLGYCGWELPAA